MQEVRSPLRKNPEVLRQAGQKVPAVRRPGRADDLCSRSPVQGLRLVRNRLREEVDRPRKLRWRKQGIQEGRQEAGNSGKREHRQESRKAQVSSANPATEWVRTGGRWLLVTDRRQRLRGFSTPAQSD